MVKRHRNKNTKKRLHRGGGCACNSHHGSGIFGNVGGGNNTDCDGAVSLKGGSTIAPFDLSKDPQYMSLNGRLSSGGKRKSKRNKKSRKTKRNKRTKRLKGGYNFFNVNSATIQPSYFGSGDNIPTI
jgi:hypothetical protein